MESAFNCVQKRRWWHPDAVIGYCLSDIDGHDMINKATYFDNKHAIVGEKQSDHLWTAYDFRMRSGTFRFFFECIFSCPLLNQSWIDLSGTGAKKVNKAVDHGGKKITAFHFHNFWTAKEEKVGSLRFSETIIQLMVLCHSCSE